MDHFKGARSNLESRDIMTPLNTIIQNNFEQFTIHPVTWCQYYDGGKAWLTTLGHDSKIFTDPSFAGGAEFKTMITGGLKSVMGIEAFCK